MTIYAKDKQKIMFIDDEKVLHNSEIYQAIRDEINRLNNPAYGKVDWKKIKTLCETLGRNEGLNFLSIIYYSTALVKCQGVIGLASGLELQIRSLNYFYKNTDFNIEKNAELYRWMIDLIKNDLHKFTVEPSSLIYIYRCEQACENIYEFFLKIAPKNVPDLEVISFVIFDYIDVIGKKPIPEPEPEPESLFSIVDETYISPQKQRKRSLLLFFVVGLIVGGISVFIGLRVGKIDTSVINALTKKESEPKILTQEELINFNREFSFDEIKKEQDTIVNFYMEQAKIKREMLLGEMMEDSIGLINMAKQLYPEDKRLQHDNTQMIKELFDKQYTRFKITRTRIANLDKWFSEKRVQNKNGWVKDIHEYASSLSPIYGRIDYIEQQLFIGNKSEAKDELDKLSSEIKSIEFKYLALMKQLKNNL